MATKLDTIHFTMERETKNTVRYHEDGDPNQHVVGVLYVQKTALVQPWPQKLTMTVEVE